MSRDPLAASPGWGGNGLGYAGGNPANRVDPKGLSYVPSESGGGGGPGGGGGGEGPGWIPEPIPVEPTDGWGGEGPLGTTLAGTEGPWEVPGRLGISSETGDWEFTPSENTGFRSFNAGNFRANLATLTGEYKPGWDAHHVLPQQFRSAFEAEGLDIDDPHFGVWWESGTHRANGWEYNQQWSEFLDTSPSRAEMIRFAAYITEAFGLSWLP